MYFRPLPLKASSPYLCRPLTKRHFTSPAPSKPAHVEKLSPPQLHRHSWLTQTVKANPALRVLFLNVAKVLGYASTRQLANRRTLHLYNELCARRVDEEVRFWQHECALPPTLQSWFTVTNLHVWLLTVRLRALPAPHGVHHIQGLIDHFFQDTEERVRHALQPGVLPSRAPSHISPSPSNSVAADDVKYVSPYPHTQFYTPPAQQGQMPERAVARQMKILKEQWTGLGLSMDLGLVRGDAELAAAVWRNLLGARGASGIKAGSGAREFRRAVNLVGGAVERVDKLDVDAEERRDDGSGVHDFRPYEFARYVAFPETMATIVAYIRREAQRLDSVSDAKVLGPREVGREGEGVVALRWRPL